MAPIIQVSNIGKKYRVNKAAQGQDTLRDVIGSFFSRKDKKHAAKSPENMREFWALKDVSFEMNEGEVLGIIGRNGAGKSTLLKILSRITTPTKGEAMLNGRVGSLLEVGTGFHPELTGRENVYFNGTILGLRKHEIKARFDEIVAFSGVEDFIDTPIKRYSSGMKMRLAFSVAAHLEPEIMIIDEVLAVGDIDFQNKCIGKMRDVSSSGRTIIFVSHNLMSIRQLCNRCIFLENGTLKEDSKDVAHVIGQYLQKDEQKNQFEWFNKGDLDFDEITPERLRITNKEGKPIARPISADEEVFVEIHCNVKTKSNYLSVGYAIYDHAQSLIYYSYHSDLHNGEKPEQGKIIFKSRLPANIFNDGEYTIQLIAGIMHHHALLTRENSLCQIRLKVEGNPLRSSLWIGNRHTTITPVLEWNISNEC